jgi:trehalose synthase-fused probable maltokinase
VTAPDARPPGPAADAAAAARWLAARRWSGARAGDLQVLAREEALPLTDDPPVALHVWRVAVGGGAPYELLVPLARRPAGEAALLAPGDPLAEGGGEVVYDATLDPDFRRALLDAIAGARTFQSAAVSARPVDGAAVPAAAGSRVGTAEQSNTSIVYGDRVIVKLFRRVEPGENPDVEIGRFLARRDFPHVPRLYGTLGLRRTGGEAVIAMAQALVPGAEDAWAYATRAAGAAVRGETGPETYAAEATRLGRMTRALHDALAADPTDPDFAPEPAGAEHVARWAANTRRAVDEAAAAAATSDLAAAELLRGRRGEVDALVDAAVRAVGADAGAAVRHHGDYHLGQVLRAAGGGQLYVIDFEGEPSRPLAERRLKHSPLRDVAGMLRSFGYAAGFAAREAATADTVTLVGDRAARWERAARGAFLGGYFAGDAPPPYLPRGVAAADALLALFELEKLVYEVRYELLNRPDWADIPLGALAERLTATGGGA